MNFLRLKKGHGPKNQPPGCNFGLKLTPHVHMWADHLKKMTAVPSTYKEVHALPDGFCSCLFEINTLPGSPVITITLKIEAV